LCLLGINRRDEEGPRDEIIESIAPTSVLPWRHQLPLLRWGRRLGVRPGGCLGREEHHGGCGAEAGANGEGLGEPAGRALRGGVRVEGSAAGA
jgi:hypothetical protein